MQLLKKTNDQNLLFDTLKIMYTVKSKALNDPSFHYFIDNKFSGYKKNYKKLFYRLWEYVRFNFSYKADDPDELIISPVFMLSRKSGDCDDFSLFILAALQTIGLNANLLLMGKEKDNFTHVAVYCNRIVLDATLPYFNFINTSRYNYFKIVQYDKNGNFSLINI